MDPWWVFYSQGRSRVWFGRWRGHSRGIGRHWQPGQDHPGPPGEGVTKPGWWPSRMPCGPSSHGKPQTCSSVSRGRRHLGSRWLLGCTRVLSACYLHVNTKSLFGWQLCQSLKSSNKTLAGPKHRVIRHYSNLQNKFFFYELGIFQRKIL